MSTLPAAGALAGTRPRQQASAVRLDGAVRLLAAVTLWVGLLLPSYWWAAGGGITDLGGWVSGLLSVGRLTGLIGSVLLLAQVVLMARVPWLEQAYGQDRLARIHRLVGFGSVNLMLVHISLTVWAYAGGQLPSALSTLWDLTWNYPGMLLAVGGTVALLLVAGTSIRAARRKLRYESWHLLHLYAYLGVGLALPHQLWTGQEFLASTARTVFWWTAWGASVAAILIWRLGLPLWRSWRHRLVVAEVYRESADTVSVTVTGRALDRLPVRAGQFFHWRFLGAPGWTRAHPYSISAAPDGRSLRLTAKALGDGSSALAGLKPGNRVLVEGPYGRLSSRARSAGKVLFIGSGVGITPLRALAGERSYAPGEATLLYRYSDAPLFAEEFAELSRRRGLEVLMLPGHRRSADSWLPDGVGRASDLASLTYWVPDVAERDVYVCGPDPWVASVRRAVLAAGVPAERFHVESFSW